MERNEMKQLLSPKVINEIAQKTGYSKSTIYMWFQGKRNNSEIEAFVLEKVAEKLETTKKLKDRIANAL
jgi:transcriptional regulator with XRE-family HTH domain